MNTKHHVATTLAPSSGAVICHSERRRVAPKMRLSFLELGVERAKRRPQLLVAGRQLDRQKGEEQDPQGPV